MLKDKNLPSNQDIPGNLEPQSPYNKGGVYPHNGGYDKSDFPKPPPDQRNEFGDMNDYNKNHSQHKRQSSTLHGHLNHSKGHSMSEPPPALKDGMYNSAPDLPPRVDRAAKPLGLVNTPTKSQNT